MGSMKTIAKYESESELSQLRLYLSYVERTLRPSSSSLCNFALLSRLTGRTVSLAISVMVVVVVVMAAATSLFVARL